MDENNFTLKKVYARISSDMHKGTYEKLLKISGGEKSPPK
jgi:hypothetical protein